MWGYQHCCLQALPSEHKVEFGDIKGPKIIRQVSTEIEVKTSHPRVTSVT
jgi:hypothetical protein